MAKVHLHVMIDEDADRQARALAAANGLTLGAVVNMALKRGLPPLSAALSRLAVPPAGGPGVSAGHLAARHPGIRQATGPDGMYPDGRPVRDLVFSHTSEHEWFPQYQDHRHEPDGSLTEQEAEPWP
jgi:hypothetical protein